MSQDENLGIDFIDQVELVLESTSRGTKLVSRMDDYEFGIFAAAVKLDLLEIRNDKVQKQFSKRYAGSGDKPSAHREFIQRLQSKYVRAIQTPGEPSSRRTLDSELLRQSVVLDHLVVNDQQHRNGIGDYAEEPELTDDQMLALQREVEGLFRATFTGRPVNWFEATVTRPTRAMTAVERAGTAGGLAAILMVPLVVGAQATGVTEALTGLDMASPTVILAAITAAGLVHKFSKNGLTAMNVLDRLRERGRQSGLARREDDLAASLQTEPEALHEWELNKEGAARRIIRIPAKHEQAAAQTRQGPSGVVPR